MGPGGSSLESLIWMGSPRPEIQLLTLVYTISERKGAPFLYPPLTMQNGIKFTATYTRETLHPLLRNWPFFLYSEER